MRGARRPRIWAGLVSVAVLITVLGNMYVSSGRSGAAGTLPPNNPPGNLAEPFCGAFTSNTYVDTPQCVGYFLSQIDAARAQEGVGPMELPSNWYSDTPAEQTFVVSDLERVDRGLGPIDGLVSSLDNDATAGAQSGQDPMYGGSLGVTPYTLTGGNYFSGSGGFANPLVADFYWMYDDGPGWDHRDAVLNADCVDTSGTNSLYCVAGAGSATNISGCPQECSGLSLAELFVTNEGTEPALQFSWSEDVAPYLPGACVDSPKGATQGYEVAASDGGIFSFGDAGFYGSTGALHLNKPIVGIAPTPSGAGYWLVASDGGIFSFGNAGYFGSTGAMRLNKPIVGMAVTPSGAGYWLVASDGGIFSFGDANFFGSTGALHLNRPIVGMAATPDGGGYWLVASDGGIFALGDANFFGSTGGTALNKPIVGMAATPDGEGYWLVASDGGIFAFGSAGFYGSTGALTLNKPIVGMASTSSGGYWLVASDGGIFGFGDAMFEGSTGCLSLNSPVVAVSR